MRTCLNYLISTLLSVPICADAGEFVGLHNGIAFRLVPQIALCTSGIVKQQLFKHGNFTFPQFQPESLGDVVYTKFILLSGIF